MIPRNEIYGIDLASDWQYILKQLTRCSHAFVPVYQENMDHVKGMLNLRKVLVSLQHGELSKEKIIQLADDVYFVPEGAATSKQLLNFQTEHKSIALVVDEYGDIQGLVTMQDILEEIVGEFAVDIADVMRLVQQQKDGSYLINGNIGIRDLNRMMQWNFPTNGPKTFSGLIIEHLEMMPIAGIGIRVAGYPIEVIKVNGNRIRQIKVWPQLYRDR